MARPVFLWWFCLASTTFVPAEARAQAVPKSPAEVKAAFLQSLDRPRVALDVKPEPASDGRQAASGLVVERVSFATEKKPDGTIERVPALIVRPETPAPDGAKRPAVMVLHGTGGNKDAMRGWLDELAKLGFVAVAIDARYHGERSGGATGSVAYVKAITRAWRTPPGQPQEHPFYYDTCWDVWRTIDYLETRDDVDPRRIGLFGISKGGIEAWLAGAVDDRVAVDVPAIAVQSFAWSLDHDAWQGRANTIRAASEAAANDLGEERVNPRVCRDLWNKLIPGILGPYDGPSMLRLFAPRPLLILNGEKDLNCPIEGAKLAIASAEDTYKTAGAEDHLKVMIASGVGHTVTPAQHKATIDWFVRWLKP